MTDAKEGWYEDPAGRHAYRWFSAGEPTTLVKDSGGRTGRDDISIPDAALYDSMDLAHEPDDGPLLHVPSGQPARLELVNLGVGAAVVVNTNTTTYRERRFGAATILVAMLPLVFGWLACATVGAAPVLWLALPAWPIIVIGVQWLRTRS